VRALAKTLVGNASVHPPCIIGTLEDFEQESKANLRDLDGRP
jgi:hypothetical protein